MGSHAEEFFVIIRTGCKWESEGGKKRFISSVGADYGLDFVGNIEFGEFYRLVKCKTSMEGIEGISLHYEHPEKHYVIKMVDDSDLTRLKRLIVAVNNPVIIYLFEGEERIKGHVRVEDSKVKRSSGKGSNNSSGESINPQQLEKDVNLEAPKAKVPFLEDKDLLPIGDPGEERFVFGGPAKYDSDDGVADDNRTQGSPSFPFFGMPDIPNCDEAAHPPSCSHRLDLDQPIKTLDIFVNKAELLQTLAVHAVRERKQYKTDRSNTKRFEAICVDEQCKWRVYAHVINGTQLFQIKTYNGKHTCSSTLLNPNHRQGKRKVLGRLIAEVYAKNQTRVYRGRDMVADINTQYKIQITYHQAWRAKQYAMELLRGTHEDSFLKLPAYCHNLQLQNPGTVTYIKTDVEDRFQFVFVAIGASLRSFQSWCRRVLVVDAAHLKADYKGMMMVAVSKDGHNQIVPVAYAICPSESAENWTLFFQKLKESIGDAGPMTFISDRNLGLAAGIATVYPDALHGICGHHLRANILNRRGASKKTGQLFWKASKAYKVSTFNVFYEALKAHDKVAWKYIDGVGKERWSRCHFPGQRYNFMTSNNVECMNSLTREARKMPIMMLMEYFRSIIQQWYFQRRSLGGEFTTTLTGWADRLVAKRKYSCSTWTVTGVSDEIFHVADNARGGRVDFRQSTCSCGKWHQTGLPCGHVIAVLTSNNFHDCSWYAESYFFAHTHQQTYKELIHPLPHPLDWEVPEDLMRVRLPIMEGRQPGRPKNNDRIPSRGEGRIIKYCTRCLKPGHTRTTCTAKVPSYSKKSTNQKINSKATRARKKLGVNVSGSGSTNN